MGELYRLFASYDFAFPGVTEISTDLRNWVMNFSSSWPFVLPEGPYSYQGKYLTIAWHVKVATKGSNLGTSDFYVADFVVSPTFHDR